VHTDPLRADHDVRRRARRGRCRRDPPQPGRRHLRRGGGQRGRQLHRLGGRPVRRPGRAAALGPEAPAARARPGPGQPLVRPVRTAGRADRAPAACRADVHLAARRDRGHGPGAVRDLHDDRLHPLDGGARLRRLRGREELELGPERLPRAHVRDRRADRDRPGRSRLAVRQAARDAGHAPACPPPGRGTQAPGPTRGARATGARTRSPRRPRPARARSRPRACGWSGPAR
jgi:hypothetical protein